MFDDQGMAGNAIQQFMEGTPVYAADGEKVGTVSEHNVQGHYLIVHKGWLFPQDVYIPLDAVTRSDGDGVYLRYTKDTIQDQDWSAAPPVDRMASAASMDLSGTTRRDRVAETSTDEDMRVLVREEELIATTREAEQGRVHLRKEVIEEQQTVAVPLTREEVRVERVPVQGEATAVGPDAFTEKDIDVPVMGEELVTSKRATVKEEVRLHKDTVTEDQQVSDTVRKERVTVEGADEVRGTNAEVTQRRATTQ